MSGTAARRVEKCGFILLVVGAALFIWGAQDSTSCMRDVQEELKRAAPGWSEPGWAQTSMDPEYLERLYHEHCSLPPNSYFSIIVGGAAMAIFGAVAYAGIWGGPAGRDPTL